MYLLGSKAIDILNSFQIPETDKNKYDVVKARFTQYCNASRNTMLDRTKFRLRKQEPGESMDDFITSLHSMAQYLGFGGLKNDMIRDQLVMGVRDVKLSHKLQLQENLTLTKAENLCRQSEVIKKHSVYDANIDTYNGKFPVPNPAQHVLKEEAFRMDNQPHTSQQYYAYPRSTSNATYNPSGFSGIIIL